MNAQPSLESKHEAFSRWAAEHPELGDLTGVPKMFLFQHAYGMSTYHQMVNLSEERGVPLDTARIIVSALLRVYITGHVR